MASLDTPSLPGANSGCFGQYPLKHVEPVIKRFITVLQIDADRLEKHSNNISKFQRLSDWEGLKKEHIYATRTVQQLKSNMKELERTRTQVAASDVAAFDMRVKDIREHAIATVELFLSTHGQQGPSPMMTTPLLNHTSGSTEVYPTSVESQTQAVLNSEHPDQVEESWHGLCQSIEELHDVMEEFSKLVHDQGETIQSIEDHVESAEINISQGTEHLDRAAKLKVALLPVAGALLGGAMGGPVGLVAGMKLGGLAAVGGGIIGYTGGFMLKKSRQSTDNNLSKKGSKSLPDLKDAVS